MTRVGVVVEVCLYREGLCTVLGRVPELEVVAAVSDWREAATAFPTLDIDVIVLDLDTRDPLDAVSRLAGSTARASLVVIAVADADRDIVELAEAGVSGYVTRDEPLDKLIEAISSVGRGELVCSQSVAGVLLRRVAASAAAASRLEPRPAAGPQLTRRELQILRLIEQGLSNKEIASDLSIEVATVKNHVHNILEKLQVGRRGDAAALLARRGRVRAS